VAVADGTKSIVTINPLIPASAFFCVLEFIYCGSISSKSNLDQVISTAEAFQCPHLVTFCTNIRDDQEFLNPSIGTWLNDLLGEKATEMFLNKKFLSNLEFQLPETVFGHKSLISARCDAMKQAFSQHFAESKQSQIKIKDTNQAAFLALLGYLYSDHIPWDQHQKFQVLDLIELGDRFGVSRLVTLAELYVTKQIERATANDITKADIDVINILHCAQKSHATQLTKFCLHFISSNYQPMSARPEFKNLKGDTLKYIEENQWPPVSYLKELDVYEKATGTGPYAGKAPEGPAKENCCVQ